MIAWVKSGVMGHSHICRHMQFVVLQKSLWHYKPHTCMHRNPDSNPPLPKKKKKVQNGACRHGGLVFPEYALAADQSIFTPLIFPWLLQNTGNQEERGKGTGQFPQSGAVCSRPKCTCRCVHCSKK